MLIGGLQRLSLCDFPGRVAAVVFTQGCNLRCPFCHNGSLIPARGETLDAGEVLRWLATRRSRLDGVVVSGGEPTLQADLPYFCARLKALGYAVKLDTNGTRPGRLRELLERRLVDFVAMDIKAPWADYERLAGVPVDAGALRESVRLIATGGVGYLFRTTVVEALLSAEDLKVLRLQIPPEAPYVRQTFRPELARDPRLREESEMSRRALEREAVAS